MTQQWLETMESRLKARKTELTARLERVHQNHRRALDLDSSERATEMENIEVVDALGNEAKEELAQVSDALHRLDNGSFGICVDCRGELQKERLDAYPYARRCIDCAQSHERENANP